MLPFGIYFFKNRKETPQLVMAINAFGYGLYLFGVSYAVGYDIKAIFHNTIGIFMLNISLFIFLGLRRVVAVGVSLLFLALAYVNFSRFEGRFNFEISSFDLMLWFLLSTVLGVVFNFYLERMQVISFLSKWELKELNKSKYKLFSVVSHDMKNIISSQSSIADFLQNSYRNMGEEEIKNMLNLLSKSSSNAYNLFEDLMVWIKNQLDLVKPIYKDIDFNSFIDYQVKQFHIVSSSKNINFDKSGIEIDNVQSDATILSLVFRNIIGNAIKYSEENSVVKIHAEKAVHGLQIKVTDFGSGMTEDQLNKVFCWESFHSQQGTNGEKGSGMGLLLSNELLGYINGSLKIESKKGLGTSVLINLPEFDLRTN